jgi:hypothetical protein
VEINTESRLKFFAALLGVFIFSVYAFTLYPSVPGGDSGELITAAYTLSAAHPPGYPLYVVLAKLFTFLPVNSIAWRVNLFSAFCGALAAVFLFLSLYRITQRIWAGVFAVGLFAFSPLVWIYAVSAEVFALNNLFVSVLIFLSILFFEDPSKKRELICAFVMGLGLTNHQTFLFVAIPYLLTLLWHFKRDRKTQATLLGVFSLGLLPYLLLPILSKTISLSQWGDSSTISGFFTQVLRRDYGTFQLTLADNADENIGYLVRLYYYFSNLFSELLFVGAALGFYGVYHAKKRKKPFWPVLRLSVIAFFFYVLVFHLLSNIDLKDPLLLGVQSRFWQQAHLLVCFWAGIGAVAISPKFPRSALPLASGIVLLQLFLNFSKSNQRNNWIIHDVSLLLLKQMPENAAVFTYGDLFRNGPMYFQACENVRPDLKLLHFMILSYSWARPIIGKLYPEVVLHPEKNLGVGSNRYPIKTLIDFNIQKFPIFSCGGFPPQDLSFQSHYEMWRAGLCGQIIPKERVSFSHWRADSDKGLSEFRQALKIPATKLPRDSWEYLLWENYWEALGTAAQINLNSGDILHATKLVQAIVDENPHPDPELYKSLGALYERLGKTDARDALWRRYAEAKKGN